MEKVNEDLVKLDDTGRRRVNTICSTFSDASIQERKVALENILNRCCPSLLSFASSTLDTLVRLDFLSILPPEISFRILSFLDARSLCQAAQVCRQWKELADDDIIWHRMCEQHINRKCEKCGWGLPLLERKLLYATKASIQKRYDTLTKRCHPDSNTSGISTKRLRTEPAPLIDSSAALEKHNSLPEFSEKASSPPLKTRPWKEVYAERCRIECNWRHGRCRQVIINGHNDGIMCLQLQRNVLASGSYDATVRLWDLTTFRQIGLLEGHSGGVTCLQFDKCKLISGSMDKTIRIWNYRTGECISTLHGHTDTVLSLSFDSTLLVSGSADHTVKLWHFTGGKRITLRGHTGPVNSVRIHRELGLVFSASDDCSIKVWSLETNMCLYTFNAHIGPVQSLALTGNRLFSCALDGTIKQWDIEKWKCVHTLFGHIEGVWEIASDQLRLVSGAHDGAVKVWEACQCVQTLRSNSGPVTSVALGDCEVISGSEDGKIHLWLFNNLIDDANSFKICPSTINNANDSIVRSPTAIIQTVPDEHNGYSISEVPADVVGF
ncbi:F-box/WD repeat protein Pof1 [Schizosaccharomyces cryophilus OY26]|uniref:F-box/WD repeat protein Pof1 n=1 Tax=Schizosaccharomyces cryophilus (strain OY26 / ATCC MYA-4695 / CBS 11777 / NBRC 106824 / NRRL Y48691) TaxID=653667 RepID=S9VYN6_SCHCR|nr:F-box/WD repeat protein Pof1 [Schizosaccharomyces cryophilus OY26]EPY50930.1 F-box/WD repeat protein Pof1 [Schizosaccharomyces cryophilus OY26]